MMEIIKTESKCIVKVWNREYCFDHSFFPSSVKIAGEEILYSPIVLNAYYSGEKGGWENYRIIPFSESDKKCVFLITADYDNTMVNADVTVEADGFIRVNLKVMPHWAEAWTPNYACKPRVSGMDIDIPIKKEFAAFMHFWPNCESAVCLSSTVLNSFATPKEGMKLPFKPYVWLGTDESGFGVCCESDENFINHDMDSVYTVENKGEYYKLHISLLDHMPSSWDRCESWGDNIPFLTYSFGFQATPIKKFNEENLTNWRAFHLCGVSKKPIYEKVKGNGDTLLERIASSGANWLILHEDWTIVQNYGIPYNEKEFKEFVKDCHKLGIKLMVYFGYEYSSLLPGFSENWHQMLNKNVHGSTVGGWQRKPPQRDYTVCYKGAYSDIMLERVKYAMDELGVDGIYTDGTYTPWECANEAHGCGYRDESGKLHEVYPIFAVREHVRKLHDIVHERGGVVDTHQSSCCLMATLGFADSYFDGENIQGMIADDISNLKLDTFRAEFTGRNMGIPCNFISYTNEKYTMRMIAGITLLHNVQPRARIISDLDFMSVLWNIFDEYNIGSGEWIPYYSEKNVFTKNDEKVYVSYYKRDEDYLLFINSLNPDVKKISLNCDCIVINDYIDKDESIKNDNGTIVVPLEYANIKIIRFSK